MSPPTPEQQQESLPASSASLLSSSCDRVRNITIIAHVDHGKTTLSDSLLSAAGKLSSEKAGKACVLDVGEAAARGITIESTAITLRYPAADLVVNLIDSPGHADFNSQVTAALRITDGALLVVDVVEGCCVQTEMVLRQALSERLRPVLVLNKADRLILDLQYTPEQMFDRCVAVISEINAIIDTYRDPATPDDLTLSLEHGTVCIGSGYFGWMTHVGMIADLYGRAKADAKTLGAITRKLTTAGDNFKADFCRYVLQPVAHIHRLALAPSGATASGTGTAAENVNMALAKLGLALDPAELAITKPRDLLRAAMKRFMPAAPALLRLIDHKLPSPATAQKIRSRTLYPLPASVGSDVGDSTEGDATSSAAATDSQIRDAIERCDPNGPVMMFVSKMVAVGRTQIALGRVFSGTLRPGMTVYVLPSESTVSQLRDGDSSGSSQPDGDSEGPSKGDSSTRGVRTARVQRLVVVEGHSISSTHEVPAGHICGVVGLQDHLVKSGTVTTSLSARPFVSMKFSVSPVVRVAIRCDDSTAIAKLSSALQALVRQDPCVQCFVDDETHEHIIAGSGELHLEVCVSKIRELCPGVGLKVSEALVAYRESVSCDSKEIKPSGSMAKSQNKHNRFWFVASPLDAALAAELEEASETNAGITTRLDILQRHGWSKAAQRKVIVCGGTEVGANLLVDSTVGVQYLAEVRDHIVSAFTKVCNEGPMSRERMRNVRIDLIDAKIHSEGATRRANQIVPACIRGMSAAIITAVPVLLEPMYAVSVQLPATMVGIVHSELSRRRGTVESYAERLGDQCDVAGYIPVMEAKSFTGEIRGATHGKAFPWLHFSHWAEMTPELGLRTIAAVRQRKGMDPRLPTAEALEDKA